MLPLNLLSNSFRQAGISCAYAGGLQLDDPLSIVSRETIVDGTHKGLEFIGYLKPVFLGKSQHVRGGATRWL